MTSPEIQLELARQHQRDLIRQTRTTRSGLTRFAGVTTRRARRATGFGVRRTRIA